MKNGDLAEGVEVLQRALVSLDTTKRWRLHLTLCELLTRIAESTDDPELYIDAMREAREAIRLRNNSLEAHFHAGVVSYKQRDWTAAKRFFKVCERLNPGHLETRQNLRRIEKNLREEEWRLHGIIRLGIVLSMFCLAGLALLWYIYLVRESRRIDGIMFTTLSSVFLGGAILGFVLPYVAKLKFAGVEAELSRPKKQISAPPLGAMGFSASSVEVGPRYGRALDTSLARFQVGAELGKQGHVTAVQMSRLGASTATSKREIAEATVSSQGFA